jgi:ribosomal protein L18
MYAQIIDDVAQHTLVAASTMEAEIASKVEFTNTVAAAAAVGEAVAKKAIPNCNIAYLEGEEMKTAVSGFLSVLFEAEPKSVGGTLPDEALYFIK